MLQGTVSDRELMEKILKEHEIEIVISAVGGEQVKDQLPLIDAIKAVGTIKVYLYIQYCFELIKWYL